MSGASAPTVEPMRKQLVVLTAALLAASLLTEPATAALLPRAAAVPAGPTITLTPPTGPAGTSIVVDGRGFAGSSTGTIRTGTDTTAFATRRSGRFSVAVTVPGASPAGALAVTATGAGGLSSQATFTVSASPGPGGEIWSPAPGTSWQWQLTTPVDTSVTADVYDIDLFDNDASVVADLHAAGRAVVCYMSAGSYEDWRSDAGLFPASVLGSNNGWPGEKWLDIRQIDVLAPIMEARLDLCQEKGFDAVEPDNIDGYTNRTGFPLTAADQLAYNRWLADAAHERGLGIALKNDVDQVDELVGDFDFAINEECFRYNECLAVVPFILAGKAVLHVEYNQLTTIFCPVTTLLGFSSMKKQLDLDAWLEPCP